LMTVGDVMAQKIEKNQMEKQVFLDAEEEPTRSTTDVRRRISLRRYATQRSDSSQSSSSNSNSNSSNEKYNNSEKTNTFAYQTKQVLQGMQRITNRIHEEIQDIDVIRSASMGMWACCVVTPGHMVLYRVLDRCLPQKTPFAIACRLASTIAYSIPNNTLFFMYGTCVHHTVEWYDQRTLLWEQYKERGDRGRPFAAPAFDVEQMLYKSRLKMEAELYPTVVNSAKLWLPTHLLNFTVVPSHFRPAMICVVSIFWNCYLSLVQHRDICLPSAEEMVEAEVQVVKHRGRNSSEGMHGVKVVS
jgi:hypothetical protein